MRKTEAAGKAQGEYCKHLRKFGKRLANKATRRQGRKIS
jgi:hypothetical protein